jgi:hypothetical protein
LCKILRANFGPKNRHQRIVMFGNRKRKLQEEDESLVPHGLIWHATAEPTPEEVAKSKEALSYTVNYAQEIERVRRQQSAQPAEQAPDVVSPAPSAKPAVIPWWRVQQPEAEGERPVSKLAPMPLSAYVPMPIEPDVEPPPPSRIQPMQIRPTPVQPVEIQRVPVASVPVQPIQAISTAAREAPMAQILQASAPRVEGSLAKSVQVQASPISEPVLFHPPAPKTQIRERLVPKSSEIADALRLVVSQLQSGSKAAWLSLLSVSGKALERGRRSVRSLELGDGLARAAKHSQNLMQAGVARTSRYSRSTGSSLSALSRAGVLRLGEMSAKLRKISTAATTDIVRRANTRPSTPSRIRVLLGASALQAKIMTARQLSAWRIRRERAAIDSRFWTSMTLSAIAAVIALVIVSVVPHYAARSLPSRILNTNPSVDANVSAPVATPPSVQKPVAPVRRSATATSTQNTAAKTHAVKDDSTKSAMNPKPKHVAQDDYVAPNTYKYYGTGSKASR